MAEDLLVFSEICDVEQLRAQCRAVAQDEHGTVLDMRTALLGVLRSASTDGRKKIRRLLNQDGGGLACARRLSGLQDRLIGVLHETIIDTLHPEAGRITVAAVGGYGRGTLAPGSDIDLLFLLPAKNSEAMRRAIEFLLYVLWDMGFKVGHATRTVEECIQLSKADMTIRTAILESRYVCGDEALLAELEKRFDTDIVAGTGREFVAAKLAERDVRHQKAGDTRYLVEPNVKEGKGGLRDLHTLFWIAKYYYRVRDAQELVKLGVLSRHEWKIFQKSEDSLWAVRCHMHFLTGKAEERLSFDIQREIAESFDYHTRP